MPAAETMPVEGLSHAITCPQQKEIGEAVVTLGQMIF